MSARLILLVSLALLVSCGGGGGSTSAPDWGPEISGPLFTVSPLALNQIQFVTGQGHLAPTPHTLPTPHVYLYWNLGGMSSTLIPVHAPAAGTITFVLKNDLGGGLNDTKIMVRSSPSLTWYLDHINLSAGFAEGSRLTVDQVIGTTSTQSAAIDLGLLDSTVINPFLAPQRYGADLINSVSPWTRFTPTLHAYFDSISNVIGADKNGAVCFDVDGTAAGNWFLDGVPDSSDAYGSPTNWPKSLAFARDEVDPQRWRISVGGTIGPGFLWAIAAGDPDPTTITPGPGIQIIRLYPALTSDGTQLPSGWLLMRMDVGGLLHLEIISAVDYPPATATDTPVTNFTGAEQLYRRQQGASG